MKKRTKYPLIVFSLILAILFFKFILYPSHLSVVGACNPEKFETDYSDKYYTAGSFSVTPSNESINSEPIIEIYFEDEEDIPVMRHELCHSRQYQMGYLFTCRNTALRLINEIECYSVERFWEIREFIFPF